MVTTPKNPPVNVLQPARTGRSRWPWARAPRGKVLAVKWGYNPNSSSLGVDITFLLFGLSIITLLTPLVGFLLRWHRSGQPLPLPTAFSVGADGAGPPA